jgi:hypothetical protein
MAPAGAATVVARRTASSRPGVALMSRRTTGGYVNVSDRRR